MEAMRKSWTDERLDHFAERVDRRFGEVNRRLDKIDKRLERLEAGLSAVQRSIDYLAVGLTGGMLAGFAAIAALLATQT